MSGQVFAVASGKGGVGKTTTVVNLGVTIRAEDHSVALVDADLGMANLATVLGIEHEPTLHDVLAGRADIGDAIVEQADRFAVVPGSRDLHRFAEADPNRLRDVITTLAESYEYVIIDTGAGLSHEDLLPLGLADQVLLITTPDPSSVGDTRKVAGFSEILGKAVRGIVVTKSRSEGDAEAAVEGFDAELLATIPDDPKVVESTAKGVPLEVYDSETPAAAAYRKLAKQLTGESIEADHMPDELEEPVSRGSSEGGATSSADQPEAAEAERDDEPPADSDEAGEAPGQPADEADGSPPAKEASGADEEPADTEAAPEAEPTGSAESTGGALMAEPEEPEPEAEQAAEPGGEESGGADQSVGDEAEADAEPDEVASEAAQQEEAESEKSKGFFGRLFGVFR